MRSLGLVIALAFSACTGDSTDPPEFERDGGNRGVDNDGGEDSDGGGTEDAGSVDAGPPSQLKGNIGLEMSSVAAFAIGAVGDDAHYLYRVDGDGGTTPIQVTQGISPLVQPQAIFSTPNYVVFGYLGVTHEGISCDLIPVRRSDGAMFCVPMAGGYMSNWNLVQVEAGGPHSLFIKRAGLYRLDLDGEQPIKTILIPAISELPPNEPREEWPIEIATTPQGDLAVVVEFSASIGARYAVRVYGANGTTGAKVGVRPGCLVSGLPGSEDNFYFLDRDFSDEVKTAAYELAPDGGTYTTRLFAPTVQYGVIDINNGCKVVHKTATKVFAQTGASPAHIYEIINDRREIDYVRVTGRPSNIAFQVSYGDQFFFAGTNGADFVITAHNLTTEVSEVRLTTQDYFAISNLYIQVTGAIAFTARRVSDSKKVHVTLPADATTPTETVPEESAPEIIVLTRID